MYSNTDRNAGKRNYQLPIRYLFWNICVFFPFFFFFCSLIADFGTRLNVLKISIANNEIVYRNTIDILRRVMYTTTIAKKCGKRFRNNDNSVHLGQINGIPSVPSTCYGKHFYIFQFFMSDLNNRIPFCLKRGLLSVVKVYCASDP